MTPRGTKIYNFKNIKQRKLFYRNKIKIHFYEKKKIKLITVLMYLVEEPFFMKKILFLHVMQNLVNNRFYI